MIRETVEMLERECNALVLSGSDYGPLPHDIDIHIERTYAHRANEILLERGFVVRHSNEGKIEAQIFVDGELFFIDIAYTFRYLEHLFPYIRFPDRFSLLVNQDRNVEKFFHYLYLARSGEKYVDFVSANFEKYRDMLFDSVYTGTPIFRKTLTQNTARGLMQKNPGALVRGFRTRALVSFCFQHVVARVQRIGSGKIIAIIGPDGSGKTSVIAALSKYLDVNVMYMGDWGFRLQSLYNTLQKGPLWVARLSYPFFYMENWIRITHAYILKTRGHTVLLDRYPGLNRHMAKSDLLVRLNRAMYTFFPGVDRYILLSAPATIIHARKQELSEEEIVRSQENIRSSLNRRGARFIEVENITLDSCLNKVLRVITLP